MPTATYIALANYTVTGSPASSVTFSSIPATYRDLVLIATAANSADAYGFRMDLNDDTSTSYFSVGAYAAFTASVSYTTAFGIIGDMTTVNPEPTIVNLMDYSATDKHKTWLSRNNLSPFNVGMWAGRWANTNAITKIKLYSNIGNFTVGSTFNLFGVRS